MVIDNKTTQMHTFSKGMNADTSDAYLEDGLYRLANNLRYITNQEENSGELHMIEGATLLTLIPGALVLAATQLRETGIIITTGAGSGDWQVYTLENGSTTPVLIIDVTNGPAEFEKRVVGKKLSLVTRWEDDDNAKLYIADGVGPIITIFLKPGQIKNIADIVAYPQASFKVPKFEGLVDGDLESGTYEYSYQYYIKHGPSTDVSPSTKLIPLHNGALTVNQSNRIQGYEKDSHTNKGIKVSIPLDLKFNRLIIYRIHYVENGVPPIIETVFDEDMPSGNWYDFTDTGINAINIITLEEYNMMTGIHIIPKTIESMTDYMFASNIQNDNPIYLYDDTTNPISVTPQFIVATLAGDLNTDAGYITTKNASGFSQNIQVKVYNTSGTLTGTDTVSLSNFIGTPIDTNNSYANPYVSYSLKSLRRGEKYRYGIILYDKYHNASAVKHLCDVIVPQIPAFSYSGNTLYVHPIGVRFTISGLAEDVVSYEIVRCGKDLSNMSTITQCVISRPISKTFEYGEVGLNEYRKPSTTSVLTPTGFVTNMDCWYGAWYRDSDLDGVNAITIMFGSTNSLSGNGVVGCVYENDYSAYHSLASYGATNSSILKLYLRNSEDIVGNERIFQVISPEYCYMSDSVKDMLQKNTLMIEPLSYLYPDSQQKNMDIIARVKRSSDNDDFITMVWSTKYYNIGNEYANMIVTASLKPLGSGNTKAMAVYNGAHNWLCYYNDNQLQQVYLSEESFKRNYSKNNSNRYGYIKLYNSIPSNINQQIEITSTGYPDSLGWDDFATATENWQAKYINHVTNVGNKPFCNWVAGGLYGIKSKEKVGATWFADESDDLQNAGSEVSGIFGPGGKCMLIAVNSSQLANDNNKIMGTYLCNIKQKDAQYTYTEDPKYSTYRSYGNYFDKQTSVVNIFDGDCFIQPFEYVSQHKWYHPYLENNRNALIVYSIPMETNINLAYTYGYELSKYINASEGDITNIQVDPSNVNNSFIQDIPLYAYNSAYSANSTARTLAAENTNDIDYFDSKFDYRVFNSVAKTNDETVDNWLKFLPSNYIDVDTRYGEITGLRKFANSLIFWQENAAGVLSVNERVLITDNKDMPLTLGTADVLSRYDYLNTSNGMRADEYADTQSDSTLYWWDHNKHEIVGYSGGTQTISVSKAKLVQNFLNEMDAKNKLISEPLLWHDKQFNEVGFTVSDGDDNKKGSLIYGENIGAFSALYTILPKAAITFKDSTLFLNLNGTIYKWNTLTGDEVKGISNEKIYPYLKYVVNANAVYTKVFDNAEFGGRIYGGGDSRTYVNSRPLDDISFTFVTPLKQKGVITGDKIDNTEYNFRFAIPRNNDASYGGRLRGKTMLAELKSTSNSYDFSLQYILTKYRISWT